MNNDEDKESSENEFSDDELDDIEDEESLINSMWFISTPKSSKPEIYSFTTTIAKNNARLLEEIDAESLDDCIDNSMETCSILDML